MITKRKKKNTNVNLFYFVHIFFFIFDCDDELRPFFYWFPSAFSIKDFFFFTSIPPEYFWNVNDFYMFLHLPSACTYECDFCFALYK